MANAPLAYVYSVKKGFGDRADRYEEMATIWPPREEGTPFTGEGWLNHLPFSAKFVLSKTRLDIYGKPRKEGGGGGGGGSGYGRSGGPAKSAPRGGQGRGGNDFPPDADSDNPTF
jgi:hypothetical protein